MKTITKLFLVALIALGMTACSNEDEIKIEGQPDATVSIRVVPSSNGPTVRAVGDLSAALPAESVIKMLEVYVFNGETLDGYGIATGENVTEVTAIETHSGPKTIYVVANAGVAIGPVATRTSLIAATRDLPADIANGLPMTGFTTETVALVEGKNQYGFAENPEATNFAVGTPLPLTRINARVAIVSATFNNADLTPGELALFDNLSDIEVAMFNVPKTSKLFGSPLETSGGFLFGEQWPTTAPSYTYVAENLNAVFKESPSTLPILIASAPYFYVNENKSTNSNEKMMIVLRAKPMKGSVPYSAEGVYTDANGWTYYPIWVNASDRGYSYGDTHAGNDNIIRNTQYNITLTIKGLGNPNIDPVALSTLDVAVSVEAWKVVEQGVIWN